MVPVYGRGRSQLRGICNEPAAEAFWGGAWPQPHLGCWGREADGCGMEASAWAVISDRRTRQRGDEVTAPYAHCVHGTLILAQIRTFAVQITLGHRVWSEPGQEQDTGNWDRDLPRSESLPHIWKRQKRANGRTHALGSAIPCGRKQRERQEGARIWRSDAAKGLAGAPDVEAAADRGSGRASGSSDSGILFGVLGRRCPN
ncbi:uncharacterized protein LAESUDRAFT_748511 [Laetiporus sulphureus 93-53]|uniref:Uncharacterized protein n=1 Tax=Laetiporus sulphureus 93-53 TaxID=1314785 RepID=A0A165FT45_9APHY|nr:uncharacterized protein LAESUDRAFT_748511 [Laetiporus sulphureus 93-53]KZT09376.1 hypothetical protein LAESUDRAFT_748511 [Laetiporus sulphureus 93-53]